MCRHLAYLGPPVTLDALLLSPPHSLLHQSWAPRHMEQGRINGDGFGVGWYDFERRREPARYRTARPMWADRSFASMAGLIASSAVLAAVRSASPGNPIEESGNAPFTNGLWLFSHNGTVEEFHKGAGTVLRRLVSDDRLGVIEGASDSEVLFALALDRLDAGAAPVEALDDVVETACKVSGGRLNLLLTDGVRVAATAFGNSLFVHRADDSVLVASEPHDEGPGWHRLEDGTSWSN
jgi:glutamine amidotransferase